MLPTFRLARRAGKLSALLVAALLMNAWATAQALTAHPPVPIIFDTDIGPDYDDVGAIALLHAMADKGECSILATIASNGHPRIAAVLSVLNTYFRRSSLPIGVVRGKAVDLGANQKWDSLITEKYPHPLRSNDESFDALKLYRKVLAGQADGTVTIVTVGFLTNMANLLQSGGDEYSPLDGAALIRRKVKQLVCMAGRLRDRRADHYGTADRQRHGHPQFTGEGCFCEEPAPEPGRPPWPDELGRDGRTRCC
jgi:hypothetical protein